MSVLSARPRIAICLGAVALALNLGCYAYQPVTGLPLTTSERVRVHLTTDGTTELARYLGPRVTAADGTVATIQPDGSLSIAVQSVQLTDGTQQHWSGEGIVSFATQFVQRVERSELNRTRSTVAAIALAGAIAGIATAALRSSGTSGGGQVPVGPAP